ncbi:hypothetical protein UT4_01070 [Ferrigenium sp. UT4]
MNLSALSTEQSPPIALPFAFFAVAPLFLLLAALLLLTAADAPFAAPHTPELLAATHAITLGCVAAVMLGALQQILPVLVGSPLRGARGVAGSVWMLWLAGALALVAGFRFGLPPLLHAAWGLLGSAFAIFITACLISLARAPARNITWLGLLLAFLSLAVAVVLGALLAHGYASGLALPYAAWAALHIKLALGGWVLLLIVGVSYQVVPMFQLTPAYPAWLTRLLAPLLFASLLLSIAARGAGYEPLATAGEILFWSLAISFAVVTLQLQRQRRRQVADTTLDFFRSGMLALLFAAAASLLARGCPLTHDSLRLLSALAFVLGFAWSVICGMLYKIMPFLVWFHLFRGGMQAGIPNMKQIIPARWMRWHYRVQLATLLAAAGVPFWPSASTALALGLLAQGLLLGAAVLTAWRIYRSHLRRLAQPASAA